IPGPESYLGSNIQPFACWPTPDDPSLNVEQLKWSCSRKFGTRGISLHWVPTLLKSRHAFLSTICISASHDDIMMRGQQAPHERLPYGSEARLKVRSEVLGLINQALANPETQSTDGTIIAILQVLNSEIMGCDDNIMQIHQNGLHDLVEQRGGLSELGLEGQLASIITITMYKALMATNLSDCWGHAAGVLFFITLIAGACANPDSLGFHLHTEPNGEEDETRKWLAAVTVRCSIVLSFEHGGVVLDTLKRLVGIQQILKSATER
ncbi:hypothetical protein CERZMDRAFT_8762, partial [Cercospora zeae-maydis SCOH1-5]